MIRPPTHSFPHIIPVSVIRLGDKNGDNIAYDGIFISASCNHFDENFLFINIQLKKVLRSY